MDQPYGFERITDCDFVTGYDGSVRALFSCAGNASTIISCYRLVPSSKSDCIPPARYYCETVQCPDVINALEQWVETGESARINLILLDINMPEMSGYEVCERLKSNEELRYIPGIFSAPLPKLKTR